MRTCPQLGPLAVAYQNAAKAAGASYNQAIAEALADSDPGQELRITGAVLNGVVSTALADVLATCHHLTCERCCCCCCCCCCLCCFACCHA